MKFPMRIFGEIVNLDQKAVNTFKDMDIYPFEMSSNGLEVEYEGPYLDMESLIEDIGAHFNDSVSGHVDCIDHENWEVLRFVIAQGRWTCKKINPDNVLEAYK